MSKPSRMARFGRMMLSAIADHGAPIADAFEAAAMALDMEDQQKELPAALAILDKAIAELKPFRDVALSMLDENDGRPRPTSWQAATFLPGADFVPAPDLLGQGTGAVTQPDPTPDPSPKTGKAKLRGKAKGGRRGKHRRRLGRGLRVPAAWRTLGR
jgi:hypothetical protein